jgi:hypothetical protein
MRLKSPQTLVFVAIALVAVVAIVLIVFRAGDSGEPDEFDVASGPSTATAQPGSTATGAAQAPTATIVSPLEGPIEDGFTHRDLAPGESPDGYGVIFIDAETGAGEFWTLPHDGQPRVDYFARYGADETHRWLWVHLAEADGLTGRTVVVADRDSGESYRFDMEHWSLVAGPTRDGLLIAQSRADTTAFAVVDLAADPTGIATELSLPGEGLSMDSIFITTGTAAMLADDTTLLLAFQTQRGEPGKGGDWRAVSIDLAAGEATTALDLTAAYAILRPTDDGGAVLVASSDEAEASATVYRVDPAGSVTQGSLPANIDWSYVRISPDGRWLAWLAWLAQLPLPPQSGVGQAWQWPVIMLADLETGEIPLRVVRADPIQWLGDHATVESDGGATVAWQQWRLAGESGLLIKTPRRDDCGPQFVYLSTGSPGCLALLHVDGSIEPLSTRPDAPFDVNSVSNDQTALNLDGTEMRIQRSANPGRDFGGGVSALPLPPLVQRPPFPDEVTLRVEAGGDGLNVRAQPGLDAEVLGSLPDGTVVTVTATPCPDEDKGDCAVAYAPDTLDETITWLHVEAPNGLSGWAVADYLTWAD